MKENLSATVRQLVEQQGGRLLHLCVCGSRSFGYASPQSDYDVRFIYAFPMDRYFWLESPPEELRLEGADAVGYELGKFLRIAYKNGWNALEMLETPSWYSHECINELRELCRSAFRPERAAHSLYGCALAYLRRLSHLPQSEQGSEVECKLLLGALRTLLAAKYSLEVRKPYPLLMVELVRLMGEPELCRVVAALTESRRLSVPVSAEIIAQARQYGDVLQASLSDICVETQQETSPAALESFYFKIIRRL